MYIDLNEYQEPSLKDKIDSPIYSITYVDETGKKKTNKFDPIYGYNFLSFYYKLKAKKAKIYDYQIYSVPVNNKPLFLEYKGFILVMGMKVAL